MIPCPKWEDCSILLSSAETTATFASTVKLRTIPFQPFRDNRNLPALTTIISHRLSGFDLFATPDYECRFVERLEESMATMSLVDAQNLQNYELALDQLGASELSKKQRPIVERAKRAFSPQEAVSAAANALAALWKRQARSNRGNR